MNQSNSIFGSTQTNQTSTFGSAQPTNTFGGSSLFGNTGQTPQQQSNTSLFGNSNNRFGMTTGTTGFTSGLNTSINVPTGTTVKFVPQTGTDTMMKNGHSSSTSINIRLQCITCMREYETKSLEELRMEDYAANRKGSSQSSIFGSTNTMNPGTSGTTGGSLFGNTGTTNTFGSTPSTGNLFNQNKPAFGTIAPTTTSNSFFNSGLSTNKPNFFSTPTNTNTGFQTGTQPFGATSISQPIGGSSLFGGGTMNANQSLTGNTQTNIFGQTPQQQTNTIFGQTGAQTANKPAFGQTATPFGATQPTGPSLFGTNTANTGNVFGATTSQPSLFNTNSSVNNNAFGTGTKPMFNFASTAPSFQSASLGPSTSTTGLFGSNNNNAFGSTSTGTGGSNLFGSSLGGGFNTQSQPFQTTNTFGSFNTTGFGTGLSGGFNSGQLNQSQSNGLQNVTSPVNTDQILARLQTLPYGSPQLLSDNGGLSTNNVKTKFTTDPKTLNQYKINAKSQAEVKVQRVAASCKPTTLLFDGLDDESESNLKCAQDIFSPRPSIKKLVLNKSNSSSLFKNSTPSSFIKSPMANDSLSMVTSLTKNKENCSPISPVLPLTTSQIPKQLVPLDNTIDIINKLSNQSKSSSSPNNTSLEKSVTFGNLSNSSHGENQHDSLLGNTGSSPQSSSTLQPIQNKPIPKCGIILNRTDYYTIPSIEECDQQYDADSDSCFVDSFTVGRIDYGSIFWNGPLNVKGINLDEIVHIRRKEVIVYPDDDVKPRIGDGLNRCAQVTLDQVWPIDKNTREFIKDPQRLHKIKYSKKVEAATVKLDAIFKEYRPDTGSWVFTVKHFSKYGLDADDEDDDEEEVEIDPKSTSSIVAIKNSMKPIQDQGDIVHPITTNNGFSQTSNQMFSQRLVKMDYQSTLNDPSEFRFTGDSNLNQSKFSNFNKYESLFEDDYHNVDNEKLNELSSFDMKPSTDLNMMRSTLFNIRDSPEHEFDNMTNKKIKNRSFNKSVIGTVGTSSTIASHQIQPPLFPCKIKSTTIKRRNLTFEISESKHRINSYSIGYSPCPRVNFFNGSNRFCIVVDSKVLIFGVDLVDIEPNVAKLENHLTNNTVSNGASNVLDQCCPKMLKTTRFELSIGNEKHSTINSLMLALFGELSDDFNYNRYQERLHRIENWLFRHNQMLPVPDKPFKRIVHFLTTNELEFAVTECINSKQPRLSYLVSSGPFVNKSTILSQLIHWKHSESDCHIDRELLKIYIVLSGQSRWTISTGEVVNVFDDLQWTQQLVINLLYRNRDHNDDEQLFDMNLVRIAIEELESKPNVMEYHLLAQNQPWITIGSCTNFFDSWFVHESLASFNVIVDDWVTNKSDSIHLFLASQCRDLRWAIFFTMHVRNEYIRSHFVRDILIRNVSQLFTDPTTEQFLRERLSIDRRLISEAKLYYGRNSFNYKTTALNLIDSDQYNEAHDILTEKVFPELVINESYGEIENLIAMIQPHKDSIFNWSMNGAGIYETFIELLRFNHNSDLERYRYLVEHFNVHQLKCPTKRHYLCQSQMARIANIIHAELNQGMYAYNTSIPDDYAFLEFRSNVYKILENDYLTPSCNA